MNDPKTETQNAAKTKTEEPTTFGDASRDLPPTKRGQERRRALLKTASELFAQRGFADVSINEIVRKTGGSLATVYRWFGGKDALFFAVFNERLQAVSESIRSIQFSGRTVEENLTSLIASTYALRPDRLIRLALSESALLIRRRRETLEQIERNVNLPLRAALERICVERNVRFLFSLDETTLILVRLLRGRLIELAIDPNDAEGREKERDDAIRLTAATLAALVVPGDSNGRTGDAQSKRKEKNQ